MKKKILTLTIFISSLLIFIISINLFANIGIYADENNTTPLLVYGGNAALVASWLRLALSGIVTVVAGIDLFTLYKK